MTADGVPGEPVRLPTTPVSAGPIGDAAASATIEPSGGRGAASLPPSGWAAGPNSAVLERGCIRHRVRPPGASAFPLITGITWGSPHE